MIFTTPEMQNYLEGSFYQVIRESDLQYARRCIEHRVNLQTVIKILQNYRSIFLDFNSSEDGKTLVDVKIGGEFTGSYEIENNNFEPELWTLLKHLYKENILYDTSK